MEKDTLRDPMESEDEGELEDARVNELDREEEEAEGAALQETQEEQFQISSNLMADVDLAKNMLNIKRAVLKEDSIQKRAIVLTGYLRYNQVKIIDMLFNGARRGGGMGDGIVLFLFDSSIRPVYNLIGEDAVFPALGDATLEGNTFRAVVYLMLAKAAYLVAIATETQYGGLPYNQSMVIRWWLNDLAIELKVLLTLITREGNQGPVWMTDTSHVQLLDNVWKQEKQFFDTTYIDPEDRPLRQEFKQYQVLKGQLRSAMERVMVEPRKRAKNKEARRARKEEQKIVTAYVNYFHREDDDNDDEDATIKANRAGIKTMLARLRRLHYGTGSIENLLRSIAAKRRKARSVISRFQSLFEVHGSNYEGDPGLGDLLHEIMKQTLAAIYPGDPSDELKERKTSWARIGDSVALLLAFITHLTRFFVELQLATETEHRGGTQAFFYYEWMRYVRPMIDLLNDAPIRSEELDPATNVWRPPPFASLTAEEADIYGTIELAKEAFYDVYDHIVEVDAPHVSEMLRERLRGLEGRAPRPRIHADQAMLPFVERWKKTDAYVKRALPLPEDWEFDIAQTAREDDLYRRQEAKTKAVVRAEDEPEAEAEMELELVAEAEAEEEEKKEKKEEAAEEAAEEDDVVITKETQPRVVYEISDDEDAEGRVKKRSRLVLELSDDDVDETEPQRKKQRFRCSFCNGKALYATISDAAYSTSSVYYTCAEAKCIYMDDEATM